SGIQLKRHPAMVACLLKLVGRAKGQGKVGVNFRRVRIDQRGARHEINAGPMIATLMRQQSQQMQRVEVHGLARQDFPICLLCRPKLAGLMKLKCPPEQDLDRFEAQLILSRALATACTKNLSRSRTPASLPNKIEFDSRSFARIKSR